MSAEQVLVTGGAGFIGSHLVDGLLGAGAQVRVLDNLLPQAHPTGTARFLSAHAELVLGDLRDPEAVNRALDGVSAVFHLGGIVGNGQSMFDIRRYIDINAVGTATLLEAMLARKAQFRVLVHTSSMVVYGDGAYQCPVHGRLARVARPPERMRAAQWEPICTVCGAEARPIPTPESHPLAPTSTYGISKRDQEELVLVHARANALPAVALRYLNVFGSRQAMSNPYTGVAAIIANRIRNRRPPLLFEDAQQRRDFVHVSDVVRANLAAAAAGPEAYHRAFNIGTGRSVTLLELARRIATGLGSEVPVVASGTYREGDIRHCFADISQARALLRWEPQVELETGLNELIAWAAAENPADVTEQAAAELTRLNVIRSSIASPRQ